MATSKANSKTRLQMRLTEEERDLFDRAATLAGANDASEWGRSLLRVRARKIIADSAEKKKKKR